jgi:hypothetical protein
MAKRRSNKPTWASRVRTPWVVGGLVLLAIVTGGFAHWKAGVDRAAAEVRAKQQWAVVRPNLVERLHQPDPIELGAVWSMHSGRICGLVNGRGSFGGLMGMTPFFTDGQRVVFRFDTDQTRFGAPWLDCNGDRWIGLVRGSTEEGFCGTKDGASRCFSTDHTQARF